MKYIQEVKVDGHDLILIVRRADAPAGEGAAHVVRWTGAARYVYTTKEFADRGHVYVLAVPVQAGLDVVPGEQV